MASRSSATDSLESNTLRFAVEIWVDTDNLNAANDETVWRGWVVNLMDHERKRVPFNSLQELPDLIRPYMEALGVFFSS